jgi:hypothetical protein
MINLGDEVKDIVTGFTGIVTAKTEWLNKCVRIHVTPQKLHEGKPIESQVFDLEQLEVLKKKAVVIEKEIPTGGDRDDKSALRR